MVWSPTEGFLSLYSQQQQGKVLAFELDIVIHTVLEW